MKITAAVRAYLSSLEVAGRLTPEAVVEDAKRDDSPLHGFFKWDMQAAAELHWLDRARQLIRSVQVITVRNDYTFKAPYYVPDPTRSGKEQGYSSVVTLKQDPTLARQTLIQECERAAAGLKRAQRIAIALGLEGELEDILARITGFAHHVSTSDHADPAPSIPN